MGATDEGDQFTSFSNYGRCEENHCSAFEDSSEPAGPHAHFTRAQVDKYYYTVYYTYRSRSRDREYYSLVARRCEMPRNILLQTNDL